MTILAERDALKARVARLEDATKEMSAAIKLTRTDPTRNSWYRHRKAEIDLDAALTGDKTNG